MARRARAEGEETEGSDGGGGAVEKLTEDSLAQGSEQSPTEEKEIEALLELMDERDSNAGAEGIVEGDSQEWDEVFMEVLSQQEQPGHGLVGGGSQEMDVDMS